MTLLEDLLKKPVGPPIKEADAPKSLSAKLEKKDDRIEQTVHLSGADVARSVDPSSVAAEHLKRNGEDPADWEVTHTRSSEWTMHGGELGQSVRFSYRRVNKGGLDLDELVDAINRHEQVNNIKTDGEYGFIIAIGDMQFGKIDGDGVEGTLNRVIAFLDKAIALLELYRERFDIEHVHLAWLGDHGEGFLSQGGANVWRTQLTQTEQERLIRRVMLYAVTRLAPLCSKLTVVAVPGNHGETTRFAGKGVTRYDDSHDTEALIAVKDAIDLVTQTGRDDYSHVEFFVPETDELTVVVEVCGTVVGHAHGHKWRPGKHFEWWKGQSFNRESRLGQCDLLLAGHLHHEMIDSDGDRLFIQAPAMESESTWWRHSKGTTGNPGLIVAVTKDGTTSPLEVVR